MTLATTSLIKADDPPVNCIPPINCGVKELPRASKDISPPIVMPVLPALNESRYILVSFLTVWTFIQECNQEVINHFAGSLTVTRAFGVIEVTKPSSEVK